MLCKNGEIDPKLSIVLEDMHDGAEKAGAVGQQFVVVVVFRHCAEEIISAFEDSLYVYIDYSKGEDS